MPAVNPEILKWARITAGLSLEEAARGIQLNPAYGKTGAQRLAEIEAGDVEPTRTNLHKMAKRYHRPLISFYLKHPPAPSDRGQDFRTLPHPIDSVTDANLNTLISKIKASQEIVRDLLEDEDFQPLQFIASATTNEQPQDVANRIISMIDLDIAKFRTYRRVSQAFEYLRSKVESIGIFVILAHNLGSHHTDIPVEVFRGFVISDDIAPFIVINDSDAQSAWSFTLLHELVHLWLGTTGISGDIRTQGDNNAIEKFCNQVAALILLRQDEIDVLKEIQHQEFVEIVDKISKFANEKNISRSMVAYKLFNDKQISEAIWQRLSAKFREEWRNSKQKEKEGRTAGGPDYYTLRRNRLGKELTGLANRALSAGTLTPSKASVILLGVKPGNVHELTSNNPTGGEG